MFLNDLAEVVFQIIYACTIVGLLAVLAYLIRLLAFLTTGVWLW